MRATSSLATPSGWSTPTPTSSPTPGREPPAGADRRAIPGISARGTSSDVLHAEIRGSTTILELLRMFPDGRAAKLMADVHFPCAHCGGAVREPLTLAAKRHRRDARAVLDAFLGLVDGYPAPELVAAARERHPERWIR